MSRTIQIPVSVDFTSRRRKWEVCSARIAGFANDFYATRASSTFPPVRIDHDGLGNPALAFHVSRKGHLASLITEGLDTRPAYIFSGESGLWPHRDRFVSKGALRDGPAAENPFEIVATFDPSWSLLPRRDPWKMREEFFELESTASALAQFLTKWGEWDVGFLLDVTKVHQSRAGRLEDAPLLPSCVVPEYAWERRLAYDKAMVGRPRQWLSERARLATPKRREGIPFFGLTDELCTTAIETTITLDHLRDVQFKHCKREDCGKPFQVQSAHGQAYCSQRCAHTVNMRRSRKAKQAKVRKSKKG